MNTQRIAFLGLSVSRYVSVLLMVLVSTGVFANDEADSPAAIQSAFKEAQKQVNAGQYLNAATTYFNLYTLDGKHQAVSLALLTENLILAGYPNAAAFFYIRTLETGHRPAIRRILTHLPTMIDAVGGDLLRKYLLKYTSEADYDAATRTHFFYSQGKNELFNQNPQAALKALANVSSGGGVMAQAAYLKGSAYAMLGQNNNAIASFEACRRMASRVESRYRSMSREADDLEARCTAGIARTYYQAGDHDKADDFYDEIPKSSFVWTDILFEQAWNAFGKGEYNRALGKLVTYRSPSLNFVFNPEVDVLRAQSFFALCSYEDVNQTVNEFTATYSHVGSQMKGFLLENSNNLSAFYGLAKQTYFRKLHTKDMLQRALNRFVRGPYFASMLAQERATERELFRLKSMREEGSQLRFRAFLQKALAFRQNTVRQVGGAFVKNSMLDLYQDLLSNLDKMSYIKLGMLGRSKQQLERKQALSTDEDGVLKRGSDDVSRKEYQYYWSFNGEFWIEELGDYVFALESQCGS